MAEFSRFRSSIGGFHRTDVSNYIEALCTEHEKALKQERQAREALQQQLEAARQALQREQEETRQLQDALRETEKMLEEALTMSEPEPAAEAAPDYPAMELEAYRRAEAAERLALERAAQLHRGFSQLVDGVATRYTQTGEEIQALTEDIRSNLKRLEEALSDLDALFEETGDAFDRLDDGEPVETEA